MPEDGIGAVAEAVEPVNTEVDAGESTESTGADEAQPKVKEGEQQDNRHQPDALKKHIADLRRRADSITDPVEKKAELDRIKFLYDTSGKARGYEKEFSTVREAREVRALLESVGGREGVTQMQATLSEIEQINRDLAAGNPAVADRMWDEAPDGMPKLMPALLDKFAQAKPQEYEKFIAPRSIGYLDQAGFPQAFDRMVQLYDAGKTDEAQAIRNELIQWVSGNRQTTQQQKQADPEVERLRAELAKRDQGQESQQVDAAYNSVVDHGVPPSTPRRAHSSGSWDCPAKRIAHSVKRSGITFRRHATRTPITRPSLRPSSGRATTSGPITPIVGPTTTPMRPSAPYSRRLRGAASPAAKHL